VQCRPQRLVSSLTTTAIESVIDSNDSRPGRCLVDLPDCLNADLTGLNLLGREAVNGVIDGRVVEILQGLYRSIRLLVPAVSSMGFEGLRRRNLAD
jgi:hypothetical protein